MEPIQVGNTVHITYYRNAMGDDRHIVGYGNQFVKHICSKCCSGIKMHSVFYTESDERYLSNTYCINIAVRNMYDYKRIYNNAFYISNHIIRTNLHRFVLCSKIASQR